MADDYDTLIERAVADMTPRRHFLLSCAVCRLLPSVTGVPELAELLERYERWADLVGSLTGKNVRRWWRSFGPRPDPDLVLRVHVAGFVQSAFGHPTPARLVDLAEQWGMNRADVRRGVMVVMWDLFPVTPTVFNRTWRTPTVEAIAAGVYADRAFDRLPVLADALEDAGCDAADLLAHLRGPGPHARGCWALDLVLGKS